MKYHLAVYVICNDSEPIYIVETILDTLEEAEFYYNQFNGKEFFNDDELFNTLEEIIYIVRINGYLNGNLVSLIKGKHKALDLEAFYPDFWKLFNSLKPLKNSRFQ